MKATSSPRARAAYAWVFSLVLFSASTSHARPRVESVALKPDVDNPVLGSSNAPVRVEYFYRSLSAEMYRSLKSLAKRHPRRVSVVFYPLGFDVPSQRLAQNAYLASKFFEFYDLTLVQGQTLLRAKETLRLRGEPPPKVKAGLRANEQRARRYNSSGNFLTMNGTVVDIPRRVSLTLLEERYDAHYALAKSMLQRGVLLKNLPFLSDAIGPSLSLEPTEVRRAPSHFAGNSALRAESARIPISFNEWAPKPQAHVRLFCEISVWCFNQMRVVSNHKVALPPRRVSFSLHLVSNAPDQVGFDANEGALAEFLACVFEQKPAWELASRLTRLRGGTLDTWMQEARRESMDSQTLTHCLESEEFTDFLKRSTLAAKGAGIEIAPTWVLGDAQWERERRTDVVADALESELGLGVLGRASLMFEFHTPHR